MLASARRSACRPAPLVGSVAANVSTAGREGMVSFMRARGASAGLHLQSVSRCTRRRGVATMVLQRVIALYSTASAFAYVLRRRACPEALQDVALPRLRADLRRGRGLAGGRHRAGHAVGGHSGRLVLSGMRCAQGRLRDGGNLTRASLRKGLRRIDLAIVSPE